MRHVKRFSATSFKVYTLELLQHILCTVPDPLVPRRDRRLADQLLQFLNMLWKMLVYVSENLPTVENHTSTYSWITVKL